MSLLVFVWILSQIVVFTNELHVCLTGRMGILQKRLLILKCWWTWSQTDSYEICYIEKQNQNNRDTGEENPWDNTDIAVIASFFHPLSSVFSFFSQRKLNMTSWPPCSKGTCKAKQSKQTNKKIVTTRCTLLCVCVSVSV